MDPLLSSHCLGPLDLKNRLVMAPMTRSRASPEGVPSPLAPLYYAQRASAGLIVTEATHTSADGGYFQTPGIHSPEQVAGWRTVVDAVHAADGKIFVQLWHTGRTSHPDLRQGRHPVGPSPIPCEGEARVADLVRKPRLVPRELREAEIAAIIDDFRTGAENAREAGFDGVELHGANGYLLDQFTRDGTNQRSDIYGGSIAKRLRFPLEVTQAAVEVMGADRVGYRISPLSSFNTMSDSNPKATFSYLAAALNELGLVYLHCVDPLDSTERMTPTLRKLFRGSYVVNSGFDLDTANAVIAAGEADLVSFGKGFLANPDLPERYARRSALNLPDHSTFYTSGATGYTDYQPLVDEGHSSALPK